jgi:hypothetical protein
MPEETDFSEGGPIYHISDPAIQGRRQFARQKNATPVMGAEPDALGQLVTSMATWFERVQPADRLDEMGPSRWRD